VRLGIAVDSGLVPNPGMVVTHFHEELDALTRHASERKQSG
jgi:hypothetical protein